MRFCTNCGKRIETDARFCMYCGTPVDPPAETAEPAASSAYAGPNSPTEPIDLTKPEVPQSTGTFRNRGTVPPVPNPPRQRMTEYVPRPASIPEARPGDALADDLASIASGTGPNPYPIPASTGTTGTSSGAPATHAPSAASTSNHRRRVTVAAAVAAVIAVVALVATTAFLVTTGFGRQGKTPTSASSDGQGSSSQSSNSTDKPDSSGSDGSNGSDASSTKPDEDSLSSITERYSSTDVSVSAMFLNEDGSYETKDVANTAAARTKFVSAGLYLPVYLAARSDGGDSLTEARTMMSTMDNGAANRAIADFGGFEAINLWLKQHNYQDTTVDRNFGDTQASAAGYENTSSTFDAVRMLAAVDAAGAADLMNVDIASEGVAVPSDMTIHAHRGQGIRNTWNYFAIVSTPHGKAAVALATQNQGKATAAQVMSDILADIDQQLTAKASK